MSRRRLTITLKKDLLEKVDEIVDGFRIRTRSHAIEYLLSKALPSKINKAMVLTGGKGIKMRPFTYELPKPMIPISGRPILEHIFELLRNNEIREVILVVGRLGDKIRSHFGDGSHFGVHLTYLDEERPSGTALPLKKAKELLKDTFLLIYGDVLAEINLKEMIDFHENHKGLATMAITSVADSSDWGVVGLRGNKIVNFVEKPKKSGVSHLINAGIFALNPKVINYIPNKKFSMLEKDVFPKLAKEGKLFGYPFEGKWFDIATPEIYEKALKEWKR